MMKYGWLSKKERDQRRHVHKHTISCHVISCTLQDPASSDVALWPELTKLLKQGKSLTSIAHSAYGIMLLTITHGPTYLK